MYRYDKAINGPVKSVERRDKTRLTPYYLVVNRINSMKEMGLRGNSIG